MIWKNLYREIKPTVQLQALYFFLIKDNFNAKIIEQ